MRKKTGKKPGVTITVSIEAHKKIHQEALDKSMSARALMNIKNGLPKEL